VANGCDEKPSRQERMAYLSSNNKRWLNIGIVVLAVLFALAIALIGVCEASGSDIMCHRRHTPIYNNNNKKPPMPDLVVVAPVFALAVHYENEAGLQCLEPVTIRMMVLGEATNVTGLAPGETNGTCVEQASCYLHPDNSICTSLQ
jgi:hypothetical protein